MKKLFIYSFLLLSFYSKAQVSVIFNSEVADTVHTFAGVWGNGSFDATALNSKFVSKFYTGSFIDKDTKDGVLNRTHNINRVGEEVNYGLFVAFRPDSLAHRKNMSYFIGLSDRQHFDARYSDDFYKVAFYGNASYAGRTAYLTDFNLNFIRYQQLQLGFLKKNTANTLQWGMGFSFLKGEQYASITAHKAELYTSQDGQFINFDTDMQIAQTDTAHRGLGAFNGYGASLDVFLMAPLKTKMGTSIIRVAVSDVGMIRFNKQSLYLNQDSLFHFTGFKINNIHDLQDSTFRTTNKDSIASKVAPFGKKAFNVTIPATLVVSFETQYTKRFQLTEVVKFIYNANYSLLFYVKGKYQLGARTSISATVGYGGYGKINGGIGLNARLGKAWLVHVGSDHIEGFIAPQSAAGMGVNCSVIRCF